MDKKSRSSVEMADKTIRPEIAESNVQIEEYDVIFLGFPIWWYVAPTIINTFLESYDFSGKKIILFAKSRNKDSAILAGLACQLWPGHTVEEMHSEFSDVPKQ